MVNKTSSIKSHYFCTLQISEINVKDVHKKKLMCGKMNYCPYTKFSFVWLRLLAHGKITTRSEYFQLFDFVQYAFQKDVEVFFNSMQFHNVLSVNINHQSTIHCHCCFSRISGEFILSWCSVCFYFGALMPAYQVVLKKRPLNECSHCCCCFAPLCQDTGDTCRRTHVTAILRVVCHLHAGTWHSLPMYKIWHL